MLEINPNLSLLKTHHKEAIVSLSAQERDEFPK